MKITLTLFTIVFTINAMCQTKEEIQDWQKNHPGQFLISSSTYHELDDEIKMKISQRVVFIENIGNSNFEKSSTHMKLKESSHFNQQEIKNWLASHSDVKILKRSEYNSFDSGLQTMYLNNLSLVLTGEIITVQDIRNYPY